MVFEIAEIMALYKLGLPPWKATRALAILLYFTPWDRHYCSVITQEAELLLATYTENVVE